MLLNKVYFAYYNTHCFTGCNFVTGDGIGGIEDYIGLAADPADCVKKCNEKSKLDPQINGATVDTLTGTECYCEHSMTERNNRTTWKSCIFKPGK